MYISQITLHNFMRYEDVTVNLSQGFNAIVGQTDAGKSTILRALIWVMYNRPLGTEMCRVGSDETSVTVVSNHEATVHTVQRLRSKKRNAYCLNGQWYDAVKNDVPLEVQEALGVHLAELGPKVLEMLNVSRQMDGPFMLSGSGGDAAKILGNLSGITQIDSGLASLRPDIQATNRNLETNDRLEKTYAAASIEFGDLEEESELLRRAGVTLRSAQELSQKLTQLTALKEAVTSYTSTIKTIDTEIAEAQRIGQLDSLAKMAASLTGQLHKYTSLLETIDLYNQQMVNYKSSLQRAQEALSEAQAQYRRTLHEAGTCPTCGARQL
jgi:chromosome segregation ATPase